MGGLLCTGGEARPSGRDSHPLGCCHRTQLQPNRTSLKGMPLLIFRGPDSKMWVNLQKALSFGGGGNALPKKKHSSIY